jgi:hypothetical protein
MLFSSRMGGRIIVHATIAHVYAIDDGITKRPAALDDPGTQNAVLYGDPTKAASANRGLITRTGSMSR